MTTKAKLPSGITQRADGSYEARVMVNGERDSYTTRDLADAIRWRDERKAGKPQEAPVSNVREPGQWTLTHAFDYGLALDKDQGGWKNTAWEKKISACVRAHILAYFGAETRLHMIRMSRDGDPDGLRTIDGFIAYCREGGAGFAPPKDYQRKWLYRRRPNSNKTINQKVCVLHKAMRLAFERGGLKAMPAFPKALKTRNSKVRYYSAEEEATMLAICDRRAVNKPAWHLFGQMLRIMIDTGVRWGECSAIRKRHIDVKRRELLVVGISGEGSKNGEERLVDLTDRALKALLAVTAKTEIPFVQYTEDKTPVLPYWKCRQMFQLIQREMGLTRDKHFTIHTARHTFCSRLVQNGVSLQVVGKLAGHKTMNSTMIYSHLEPKNRRDAINVLNRLNEEAQAA